MRLPRYLRRGVWFGFAALFAAGTVAPAQQSAEVQSLLRQGSAAMQHGELATAEQKFQSAVKLSPENAEAQLGLGLVELRGGMPEAASGALATAARLDGHLGGAHLFLGIAQFQTGRTAEAASSLRAELALDPHNKDAATWLTMVLLAMDQAPEAAQVVDRAVHDDPHDAQLLYLQAKAHGAVVKEALASLYQMDPDSALVHQAAAESMEASGAHEKAIAEYQAALRREPGSPDLLEALGEAQQQAGHPEAAAQSFKQVLARNPQSAPALYALGRIKVEGNEAAEGVALLQRAQAAHADASPTSFYLGMGLAKLGRDREAEQALRASLTPEAPGFVQQGAWFQLARVYARLGEKAQAQDALEQLKKVVARENQSRDRRSSPSGEDAGMASAAAGQPQ